MARTPQLPAPRFGQYKRPGIPRINWRHPLAADLVFYGIDVGGQLLDLTTSRKFNIAGTAIGQIGTPQGSTANYAAATSYSCASDAAIRNVTAPFTFACAYFQSGTVGQFARPFGRTANNGGNPPYLNWDFEINPSGLVGQDSMIANVSSGLSTFNTSFVGGVNSLNAYHTAVGTFVGSTLTFYLDGISRANNTGANYATISANDNIVFAGASAAAGTVNPFIGSVYWGAFWSRLLSAAEIRQLHLDPYCLLTWPEDRIAAMLVGAAAFTYFPQSQPDMAFLLRKADMVGY